MIRAARFRYNGEVNSPEDVPLKFKSYYWAIIGVAVAVVLILFVLPRVFPSVSSSGSNPHGNQPGQTVDYTPEIQAYQDLVKANPNDDVALEGLGSVYEKMGQYLNAKDNFEKACEIKPNDAEYHGRLGEAYFALDMTDIAMREFNNGLAIDPNNQAILIDVGIVYSRDGNNDQARTTWQKAENVNPTSDLGHTATELIAQMDKPASTTSTAKKK